ncbi:MAG: CCA tRNA nucleotidyltransferase [Microgenomates group bacterium]
MLKIPIYIENIFKKFKKEGYEIYLVGGAVRDLILKKEVNNWDFTTNAKPEEIQKLFPESFYNNQYGTVSLPLLVNNQRLIIEITPFRKEGKYNDYRHPKIIQWAKTLKEDLSRRDFTINAIAYDGKKIIDPYHGQEDIKNKLISAVGDPEKRFQEDALRLIRAIRFASQLGFLIEEKTRLAINKNAHLIRKISWERIRDEFLKILTSPYPAEGIFFLHNTGLLKYILPELEICFNIPQKSPKRHHIYDVGTHLVLSLKYCESNDPITRLATLIHDIGKAKTFKKDEKTGLITFYNHEVVGKKLAEKIAERFRLSNKQKDKLVKLVRYHQFSVKENQTDKALRRFIRNVGKEYLDDIIALRFADRLGSGAKKDSWRFKLFRKRLEEVQKEPFKITDLKINGFDVMKTLKIKPGPAVGKILKTLFDKVLSGELKNEREVLLNEIKKNLSALK